MRPLRILTWHVHGNYLYYLSQTGHELVVPVKPGRPPGFGGLGTTFPFGDHVREVAADRLRHEQFDCILFQSRQNYETDQYELLSPEQQRLPRVYLEHDPPREHPTDTRHPVDDPDVLLVHVTAFNDLMWDSGRTPTRVIEHGVVVPEDVRYSGKLARGLVVVNNLRSRGRRLGLDIFERARDDLPLDLVGMDAESLGGLGEIEPMALPAFMARYRLFFHPVRYTSLGLALCEAMTIGMPIVGLATTELVTVVEDGVSGYISTNPARLVEAMRALLADPAEARRLGEGARRVALERFDIERFVRDWNETFALVTDTRAPVATRGAA